MPVEFDPAWEYATADPEVYAAVYGNGRRARSVLDYLPGDEFGTPLSQLGYRFGRGNPDYFSGRLARPKPERYREPPKPKPPTKPRAYLKPRCCGFCNILFKPVNHKIRFCSRDCFHDHRGLPVLEVECLNCQKVFKTRKPKRVFCSRACWREKKKASPHRTCRACGARFKKTNSRKGYCSVGCQPPRGRKRELADAKCLGCGNLFRPGRRTQRYCSLRCRPAGGMAAVWVARTNMNQFRDGDEVILHAPENPRLHAARGVVNGVHDWGCVVLTPAAATGQYRAAWHEMEYAGPKSVPTGEVCKKCQGSNLVRTGSCKTCQDCGENEGCG